MSKKTINIKIDKNATYEGPLKEEVVRAVRRMRREVDFHFEQDAWDLDYYLLKDGVVSDVLGHSFSMYLMSQLLKPNRVLTTSDKGLMLRQKTPIKNIKKKKGKK